MHSVTGKTNKIFTKYVNYEILSSAKLIMITNEE
jgi:hypothetical protein